MLPCYLVTMLYVTWYHVTMLPCYCNGCTVPGCYYVTCYMLYVNMLPCYMSHDTMLPCYYVTMLPWYHVIWYHITMLTCYCNGCTVPGFTRPAHPPPPTPVGLGGKDAFLKSKFHRFASHPWQVLRSMIVSLIALVKLPWYMLPSYRLQVTCYIFGPAQGFSNARRGSDNKLTISNTKKNIIRQS